MAAGTRRMLPRLCSAVMAWLLLLVVLCPSSIVAGELQRPGAPAYRSVLQISLGRIGNPNGAPGEDFGGAPAGDRGLCFGLFCSGPRIDVTEAFRAVTRVRVSMHEFRRIVQAGVLGSIRVLQGAASLEGGIFVPRAQQQLTALWFVCLLHKIPPLGPCLTGRAMHSQARLCRRTAQVPRMRPPPPLAPMARCARRRRSDARCCSSSRARHRR